nr:ferrous iron transporter A [Staphylococcus aureus]
MKPMDIPNHNIFYPLTPFRLTHHPIITIKQKSLFKPPSIIQLNPQQLTITHSHPSSIPLQQYHPHQCKIILF